MSYFALFFNPYLVTLGKGLKRNYYYSFNLFSCIVYQSRVVQGLILQGPIMTCIYLSYVWGMVTVLMVRFF